MVRTLLVALTLISVLSIAVLAGKAGTSTPVAATIEPGKTRDYVAEVRAEFTPENRRYSAIRTRLAFLAPFYAIAAALLLLFTGLAARLRDFVVARFRGRYLRVLVAWTLFVVAGLVLEFPLVWFHGFVLEHRFHLSNQSFAAWLGELGIDATVAIVLLGASGLLALASLAIEKSPRRWWLWLALGSWPVIVVATLIQPIVIDPLYNQFTPLRDRALEARIVALAGRAGIPGRRVFQVDKSRQTNTLNAYVSGFGPSQRIVLWDTTLEGMSADEILFVMGHEMGHYRLGHIWKGIAFYAVLSLAVFYLVGRLSGFLLRRFGRRWRVETLHDPAALPLFVVAFAVIALLATPIANAFSRSIEHQADVFALEVTHLNDAGARAFLKLGSSNKSNPEPRVPVKLLLYTHPPLIERIRFALQYRPWERGEPNRAFRPAG